MNSRINFIKQEENKELETVLIRNNRKRPPMMGYCERVESLDDIISMPSNAKGNVNVGLKGTTVTNLLGKSGNFENISDWRQIVSVSGGTSSLDNLIKLLGDSSMNIDLTGGNVHRCIEVAGLDDKKYYEASVYVYIQEYTDGIVRLHISDGNSFENPVQRYLEKNTIKLKQWIRLKVKFTSKSSVRFSVNALNGTLKCNFDCAMLREISKEEFDDTDNHTSNYIDNTQSVLASQRITSCGKNIIDIQNNYILKNLATVTNIKDGINIKGSAKWARITYPLDLIEGEKYTLSRKLKTIKGGTSTYGGMVAIIADDKNKGSILKNSNSPLTFTAPPNAELWIYLASGENTEDTEIEITELQLEKSNGVTDYEPYIEDVAYIKAEQNGDIAKLRSLPNGVCDEIRSDGKGGLELVQNLSDEVYLDDKWVSVYDSSDNPYMVLYNNVPNVWVGRNRQTNSFFTNDDNYTFFLDTPFTPGGVPFVGFRVPRSLLLSKGYTDDKDGIRKYALDTNTRVIYRMEQPKIIPIECFGEPVAFPNGTMYFDTCLWGFINFPFGRNSKTITTQEYPIKGIKKVIRYDITDDGRMIEADVTSDCTHTDTTLTIANVDPKKTYFYDCDIKEGCYANGIKSLDVEVENGVVEHDFKATATPWTLNNNENKATMLICKNAGGATSIVAQEIEGKMYIIRNLSGQNITIKSNNIGVTVANNKTATVIFYANDFIKAGEV